MAPEKRRRVAPNDDELDELSDVASPELLSDTQRKKARRSAQPPALGRNGDSGLVDREADYETQRDAGFEDLMDEDMDTLRATQIIQMRNQRNPENKPADNGIIEAVTCINFMCHTKLHVAFGPLINFIIGHNGSGKSAVLTALTICLGGKASSTNRGQSLKSFIKEGEESATLIVKLKNGGENAFQPETFGDSIIVERHFTKTGASGFKLKSSNGRIISTKKSDVEEICDCFALQLDNPMNVLTQDMARQFLSNSSPAEKYRFYVKGVQLEQLDQDYQILEETINSIEDRLSSKEEDLRALERAAHNAAQKLALYQKHDTFRKKIKSYENQMGWAQVEAQEKLLAEFETDLAEADRRILEAQRKAGTVDQVYDDANQEAEHAKEVLRGIEQGLGPIQDERKQAQDSFDKTKTELLGIVTEQRSIKDHINKTRAQIEKLKRDIAEEHERLEAADGGQHAQKLAEIEAAREAVTEAKIKLDEHREDLPRLEEARRVAMTKFDASKGPIDAKKHEIKQCDDMLRTLQRDRGQRQGVFDPNMPNLLRAIRNERGFQQVPVGPIGDHVQLLKPIWSSILERSLGGTLNSFIVTSKRDQMLLSKLMQKTSCKCAILIGNNHHIDTSRNEPDPDFDTTLRVLEIDNDLVKRQLIINQGIEQTILIEKRADAQRAMYAGPRLRNVRQCFCLHDDRRGWGIRYAYGRGNEQSSSPMNPFQGKARMKTDTDQQIRYQEETLQYLKREVNDLEAQSRELRSAMQVSEQEIVRHNRRAKDLLLDVQRAEENVDRLRDELEQDRPVDGRLDALKTSLQETEEELRIHEGSYEESVNSRDRLRGQHREHGEALKKIEKLVAEHEAEIRESEAKVLKKQHARQNALHEKNTAIAAITACQEDKSEVAEKIVTLKETIDDYIRQASIVGPRVPIDPGETTDTLDKKLDKLAKDLNKFHESIGASRQEIEIDAIETRKAADATRENKQELDETVQLLKRSYEDRQDRWRKFRRFISARARGQFTYLLSERSFKGALKTDHMRRLLDLHVEPDQTKSGKGRQTKTLSGGEKSFATICLLLSLWEAMGSPIRCLDEFDVFMDNVNRDVSLKMMIQAARRSVSRQFVLITPQSMGNVDVAGDVKIIKLSDPERGQTALQFGAP